MTRNKKAPAELIQEALYQFVKEARSSSEDGLPALVSRLHELVKMPEGNAEELLNEIRGCQCASQVCEHPCTKWGWDCKGELCNPGLSLSYCEDCFAFTHDLFTFCHCGQRIMPSHNLSNNLEI